MVDAELELDVRDAPLRQLEIVPACLVVAAVDGNQVGDYHLTDAAAPGGEAAVRVIFKEPVSGGPAASASGIGARPPRRAQSIPAIQVTGAKVQRGYVVVSAESGIEIDQPQVRTFAKSTPPPFPCACPGPSMRIVFARRTGRSA